MPFLHLDLVIKFPFYQISGYCNFGITHVHHLLRSPAPPRPPSSCWSRRSSSRSTAAGSPRRRPTCATCSACSRWGRSTDACSPRGRPPASRAAHHQRVPATRPAARQPDRATPTAPRCSRWWRSSPSASCQPARPPVAAKFHEDTSRGPTRRSRPSTRSTRAEDSGAGSGATAPAPGAVVGRRRPAARVRGVPDRHHRAEALLLTGTCRSWPGTFVGGSREVRVTYRRAP